jgi:dUTPase
MIPFRVKLLTDTAKAPEKANESDLWDLFADSFNTDYLNDGYFDDECKTFYSKSDHNDLVIIDNNQCTINPMGRILVKTGIIIELPQYWTYRVGESCSEDWLFTEKHSNSETMHDVMMLEYYAVADIRPRSGLALKHGITVLNSPGTIDNSYRKEIGVILINQGHEPYKISKGDKIAQMLIRPLYPSRMEIISEILDTNRGGYGSTGK